MQGPMPSTDGAIGLGLSTVTLVMDPSLRTTKFDALRVDSPCGATLLADAHARVRTTSHKQGERARGRPRHAELSQLGSMVGLGRLVGGEVAG